MTKRENLLRALRRDHPEFVPFDMDLSPEQLKRFKERTGTEDFRGYYDFAYRYVELNPTKVHNDYSKYYADIEGDYEPLNWNPEWGVMGKSSKTGELHFQQMLHPMRNFEDISEIEEYPFPDFNADYRWEGVKERNLELIEQGYATMAFMEMTIFELAWYLRGMEDFMSDFYSDPEFNAALLDKITDIRVGKGGGLVLGPTHVVEPEVPYENVEAFLEAVEKFGKYE